VLKRVIKLQLTNLAADYRDNFNQTPIQSVMHAEYAIETTQASVAQ